MKWRSALLTVSAMAALFPSGLFAQARTFTPGERVRITSGQTWTGTVQRSSVDSIAILPGGGSGSNSIVFSLNSRYPVCKCRNVRVRQRFFAAVDSCRHQTDHGAPLMLLRRGSLRV